MPKAKRESSTTTMATRKPTCDLKPKTLKSLANWAEGIGLILAIAGPASALVILTQQPSGTPLTDLQKSILLGSDIANIVGYATLVTASTLLTRAYSKLPSHTTFVAHRQQSIARRQQSAFGMGADDQKLQDLAAEESGSLRGASSALAPLLTSGRQSDRSKIHKRYLHVGIALLAAGVAFSAFGFAFEDLRISQHLQDKLGPVGATGMAIGGVCLIVNFVLLTRAYKAYQQQLAGATGPARAASTSARQALALGIAEQQSSVSGPIPIIRSNSRRDPSTQVDAASSLTGGDAGPSDLIHAQPQDAASSLTGGDASPSGLIHAQRQGVASSLLGRGSPVHAGLLRTGGGERRGAETAGSVQALAMTPPALGSSMTGRG
jgi:hypothetical protein